MARSRTAKRTERQDRFRRATGTDSHEAQTWLLDQLINALPFAADAGPEGLRRIAEAALSMMEAIAPQDAVEAMLAVQMLAAHAASLECTRRAKSEGQSVDARDKNLRHAACFTALFGRQAGALRRWRAAQRQLLSEEHHHLGLPPATSDGVAKRCKEP